MAGFKAVEPADGVLNKRTKSKLKNILTGSCVYLVIDVTIAYASTTQVDINELYATLSRIVFVSIHNHSFKPRKKNFDF